MADHCECFLPIDPPTCGTNWWQPAEDEDPGRPVRAVVRYGEDAELRRAVRRSDGSGWCEHGAMVDFYHDITPPMPWTRVGMCWADTSHPVVAVHQEPDKRWVVDV